MRVGVAAAAYLVLRHHVTAALDLGWHEGRAHGHVYEVFVL